MCLIYVIIRRSLRNYLPEVCRQSEKITVLFYAMLQNSNCSEGAIEGYDTCMLDLPIQAINYVEIDSME